MVLMMQLHSEGIAAVIGDEFAAPRVRQSNAARGARFRPAHGFTHFAALRTSCRNN
jgi:hypothetical protein